MASIFISRVRNEFERYSREIDDKIHLPNLKIETQENFINTGETQSKLNEYISSCDMVVHLVGDITGHIPTSREELKEVTSFLNANPKILAQFEWMNDHKVLKTISLTQWEAWLALYHEKQLIISQPA
ncbi:MAG: hypothetical protein AB8B49_08240 [Nitratireductor sp.]